MDDSESEVPADYAVGPGRFWGSSHHPRSGGRLGQL